MALGRCVDCHHNMSTSATACTNCGCTSPPEEKILWECPGCDRQGFFIKKRLSNTEFAHDVIEPSGYPGEEISNGMLDKPEKAPLDQKYRVVNDGSIYCKYYLVPSKNGEEKCHICEGHGTFMAFPE